MNGEQFQGSGVDGRPLRSNDLLSDGGPAILDDCEAWCETCQQLVTVFAPWQDMCPRGHWITRTFYDDDNEQRRIEAGLEPLHG